MDDIVDWMIILFNGTSNFVGYLMPNLVFCIYDFISVEIIFNNFIGI